MEPQPQMQPINPVEGRPFAEPQQPLDLRPKRQPLDLRPRPNYRPLDVPDLRPARAEELRPSMNPLDRSNTQGAREAVGRVVNNPIGYTPGKALTWPLAVADRSGELHDELTQPNPMQTMDVPSIPLPNESFPDLETSPTTKLAPDAIGSGPLIDEGTQQSTGGPGSRPIQYLVQWTSPSNVVYSTGETVQGGFTGWQTLGVRTGPLSLQRSGNPEMIYLVHATGADLLSAGDAVSTLRQWDWRTQTYIDVTITQTASPAFTATPVDGSLDPELQPPRAPSRAPNPARQPLPDFDPDFLDLPDSINAPGFQSGPELLPPPAPTGEIIPYQPPPWTPPDRIPYTPPEKQPWMAPDPVPDFDTPPGQKPKDDKKSGTLGPPWWKAWEDWYPPDDWTYKKRNPRGNERDQLPPTQPTPQPPPVAVVPYDGCCMETLAKLREIQRELEKLKVDADIPTWKCDTTADPPAPLKENQDAKDLTTAFNLLGQEIAAIREQFTICPPAPLEQAEHSEMAKDTATEGKTVWYVPLPAEVKQVELIITGELPKSFRLYETSADGEQQAKFGALALSCSGVTGGHTANSFHQWCWTRRTSMYLGNRSPRENFLRVYVRSGLSWVLYDTGLRE